MTTLDWIIPILLVLAAGLRWFAVGLPERGAKYRFLSLLVLLPILTAALLAGLLVWGALPGWLAWPCLLGILGVAFAVVYSIVSRILPRKISSNGEDE